MSLLNSMNQFHSHFIAYTNKCVDTNKQMYDM